MKAAVNTVYGPPSVIDIRELPKPVPKDDEVLIRVHASTVNRTDCGFLTAEYFIVRFFAGLLRPKNQVLGCEFAGEIVSVGKDVTEYRVGDRVFGFNDTRFGAHAEYMVMPAGGPMALIPDGMRFAEAAALTEGVHYALFNIRAAGIKASDRVLINGATGAIGSAAVQLVKDIGAHVTAVCATPYIEVVRSLGADRVIDYTREDFTSIDDRFDVVFDAVGKSTFGKCKRILTPKGIYMSTEFGPWSQNILFALVTPLFGGKRLLFPLPSIRREDVEFFKLLAERGRFKPLVDRTYPLEEIRAAYTYVLTGRKIGNVILEVVPDKG